MFQAQDRTLRLSIVEGTDYGGTSIGNGISGKLFKAIGYSGVFGVSAACLLVAVLYGAIFVKESLKLPNDDNKKKKEIAKGLSHVKKVESSNDEDCASLAWQSVMYILEGVRTVVTPREGWRRALVLLGVFQYICYTCGYTGTEGSHRLYFVENKYKWSEEELSTYLFNLRIACWLGLWLLVPFLTNVVKISDSIIAVIAVATASAGTLQ